MIKCSVNTFCHLYSVFQKGFHRPFHDFSESASQQLERNWNSEIEKCKKPNLFKILIKTFGIWPLIFGGIYSSIEIVSHIQIPFYVGCIISYYGSSKESIFIEQLTRSTTELATLLLLTTFLYSPMKIYGNEMGTKIRVACSTLIYKKSLDNIDPDISESGLHLLTNDVQKLDNFLIGVHHIWKTPVETFIIVYIMYREIGVAIIFGTFIILAAIPLQTVLISLINDGEMHLDLANKKRVSFVEEVINGIKVIKMFSWEKLFITTAQKLRGRELNIISQRSHLYSILYSLKIIPRVAVFVTYIILLLKGNLLMSKQLFMISLYYYYLNASVVQSFSVALIECRQAVNTIYRIQNFLLKPNRNKNQIDDLLKTRVHNTTSQSIGISLDNVSANWDKEKGAGIYSIDLTLHTDCIYGITGASGCGKSTLLNTIVAELEHNEGRIEIRGTISYGLQDTWLFDGTVKENIIFNEQFDEDRYKTVCRICALERDFELLQFGEETAIDVIRKHWSDEQKSKINLARALYRQADIYLIDDPLCLSNPKVGEFIFENGIQKFLKGKCVVLVTNEMKYLKLVNETIMIENGCVKVIGKFNQTLFETYYKAARDSIDYSVIPAYTKLNETITNDTATSNFMLKQPEATFSTLLKYCRTLQNTKLLLIGTALIGVTQISMTGIDVYISEWTKLQENNTITVEINTEPVAEVDLTKFKPFLYMYTILMIVLGYLVFQRTFTLFRVSLDISRNLHNKLYDVIFNTNLKFYKDFTPGKLIQSFSHDMKNIDLILPMNLLDCLIFLVEAIFIIIYVVTMNQLLVIPSLVLISLFWGVRNFFKRLFIRHTADIESMHLNNFKEHLNSSLEGATNIRIFNAESQFVDRFNKCQNSSLNITYLNNLTLTLFTYVIDIISCFYVIAVTGSLLFTTPGDIDSSSIGLIVTQVFILKDICQRGMRKSFDVETRLSSVSNILQYNEYELESSATHHDLQPNPNWPKYGNIVFRNVKLRGPDNILQHLNFEIKSNEKVAILGIEKTFVIDTLFRFYTPESGIIKIDGFDIEKINVMHLRRSISIIVHDPIIFTGTVRYNLDPFNKKTDLEIIKVLRQIVSDSDLNNVITNLHNGVEHMNLQQKQIICMVRALLPQNQIVIVDESAGNFDEKFSKIIHQSIQKMCADSTVIVLANRLNNIMDCDRIMILEMGHIVEYDKPYKIVEKSNKYFNALLETYEESQRDVLVNIAKKNCKLL